MRDLASGYQLLWLPVAQDDATSAIEALVVLFTIHGAPLVLKSDNGSAFIAGETRELLRTHLVCSVYSQSRTPSYNGSIEAAIDSLKERTQEQATSAGCSDMWTSNHVQTACQQANTRARPRRLRGRTPFEGWHSRRLLATGERKRFQVTVASERRQARVEKGIFVDAALDRKQEATLDRIAQRRALVAHDFLWFRMRQIPAPILRPKVTSTG